MTSFRNRVGRQAVPNDSLSIDIKSLGETIGRASSVVKPSEEDGDGDGFVTGRDGKDNVPVVKPVVNAVEELWSDKKQKALSDDEKRVVGVANKLKGRKPKYDVARMHELIVGAKNREDAIAARKLTREWAKSIFEMKGIGENGDYSVRLFSGSVGVSINGRKRGMLAAHNEHPHPHVEISGEIVDKNGKKVGMFSRKIFLTDENSLKKPHVYHEFLRIDPEYKGKGIGSDFTLGSEMMYREMGLDEVHLNAGLSDGTYTWLRAGYQFKDDEQRVKLAKEIEKRYKQMLKDAGSKEKLVAGGFATVAGRHYSDSGEAGTPIPTPSPFLGNTDELDKFLKILGQLKTHPAGSDKELPPMALTMFGDFSRRILKGINIDVQKRITPSGGTKSLRIFGFDKLFTRV